MRDYCAPKTTWKPPWRGWRDATETPKLRSGNKMPEKSPSVCCGQGRDVKIRSEIGLERFQAQPKREIPGRMVAICQTRVCTQS